MRLADRRPDWDRGLTGASRAIVAENLWRAQRDGVRAELIDLASGTAAPLAACLDAVLALLAEDADTLGCGGELAATCAIVAGGTSADRQLAISARRGAGGRAKARRWAPSWTGSPRRRPGPGESEDDGVTEAARTQVRQRCG